MLPPSQPVGRQEENSRAATGPPDPALNRLLKKEIRTIAAQRCFTPEPLDARLSRGRWPSDSFRSIVALPGTFSAAC